MDSTVDVSGLSSDPGVADDTGQTWVVVLAAGEGSRLLPLTREIYGCDLPKQFAVIEGDRSMLQATVERALRLASPSRIVVVVGESQEAIATEQLVGYGVTTIAQPKNLDTGPGLLLPLVHVRAADPTARVVVMPADHYIPRPDALYEALDRVRGSRSHRDRLALVGVVPDRNEVEYGWVVPGRALDSKNPAFCEVTGFREKPNPELAEALRDAGGMWNTFILTGPVATFFSLAREFLSAQLERFEGYARRIGTDFEVSARREVYEGMPTANFSREVLERANGLCVVRMASSGWSDWGSPRRVFESLEGAPALARLIDRIERRRTSAPASTAVGEEDAAATTGMVRSRSEGRWTHRAT